MDILTHIHIVVMAVVAEIVLEDVMELHEVVMAPLVAMEVAVVIALEVVMAHPLEVFNNLNGGVKPPFSYLFYHSMHTKKFHLSLILTNQCNLSCIYCYENNKTKKSMDVNVCKDIIAKYLNMPDYDEVEIDFFGGEPFLEFTTIKTVCEWVWSNQWRNKYIFFATTNGVLVQGEIKEWLRKYKNRFWVPIKHPDKSKFELH